MSRPVITRALADADQVQFAVPTGGTTGGPQATDTAPMSALAAYLAAKLAPPGTVNVASLVGNATGSYTVPGIAANSRLLLGVAANSPLASAAWNYDTGPALLVSSLINPAAGWNAGNGLITDPTSVDWTGWSIFWLWQ